MLLLLELKLAPAPDHERVPDLARQLRTLLPKPIPVLILITRRVMIES